MTSNSTNIIRIQQYLKGQLSPEEMNKLEREALDDPFLNDALEGYTQKGLNPHQLTLLQQRLQDRITEQPQERNRMLFTSQRLGIATAACLLFILACVLLWMVNNMNQANNGTKEVTVELNTEGASGSKLPIAKQVAGSSASPAGGWDRFNNYIAKNVKASIERGEAIVRFEVDEEGRPFSIQAIKGNEAQIDEAKRLLEAGPRWQRSKFGEVAFVFD
ncbi:hypothetical protein [Olivibacter sp. XZL3]|uniref:hypothetical protein n=1 Tax=Olivibacter sp. XZL3 TaxID=1735116 RepID=UPI0010647163|nr:hypothetical protein [Olivibacter sp. XZL3]